MPCADDWVRAVAALPASLWGRFPASIASPEAIEVCLNKRRFAEQLEREGLPHPRTILLDSPRALESFSDADFCSAFLKPCGSQEFGEHYGVKAFRVQDRAEAIAVLDDAQRSGVAMMLQEYIPGPPSAHYFVDGFVDRRGQVCARFARRRLRMYPLDFGNSSFHVSIALQEVKEAVESVDRLLAVLRYRGIFSAEFKFDQRDGLFKILEVNARPWWYVEFAARSGVDVCSLAYRDALGLSVDPVADYQIRRRCVHVPLDLAAYRFLRRQGQLRLWPVLRSWVRADHPVFCWSDPVPGLARFLAATGEFLRRLVMNWLRPGLSPAGRTKPEKTTKVASRLR